MRRFSLAYIVLLIMLLMPRGVAADDDRTFEATMSGDQEVPLVDTEMTGSVSIRFNDDFTAAEFRLKVNEGVASHRPISIALRRG